MSGISSGLGLQYLLDFIGMPVILELQSDSSAARGVLWRTGVGKIRHLEVKTLWVQDLVKAHKLLVRPVKGEENVADIGSKVHPAPRLLYLRGLLGLKKIDELQCFGGRVAAVGSFAGRVKRLLASVLACAPCAAGRQVANYDEKVNQVTTDINNNYERNTFWAYMMIAVIFILGMAVGAITQAVAVPQQRGEHQEGCEGRASQEQAAPSYGGQSESGAGNLPQEPRAASILSFAGVFSWMRTTLAFARLGSACRRWPLTCPCDGGSC